MGRIFTLPLPVPVQLIFRIYGLTLPVSGIENSGVTGWFDEITRLADLLPKAEGVNVPWTVHLSPWANVGERPGQGALPPGATVNMALSVPAVITEATESGAPVELAMVKYFGADVAFISTHPNDAEDGVAIFSPLLRKTETELVP